MDPGTRRASRFGQNRMIDTDPSANAAAGHCRVPKFSPSAFNLSTKSAGTVSSLSPRKSLICVLKINTAIPQVNPIVTG